jgi:hypothetical protein
VTNLQCAFERCDTAPECRGGIAGDGCIENCRRDGVSAGVKADTTRGRMP